MQLALSTVVSLPHILQRSKPRARTSLQGLVANPAVTLTEPSQCVKARARLGLQGLVADDLAQRVVRRARHLATAELQHRAADRAAALLVPCGVAAVPHLLATLARSHACRTPSSTKYTAMYSNCHAAISEGQNLVSEWEAHGVGAPAHYVYLVIRLAGARQHRAPHRLQRDRAKPASFNTRSASALRNSAGSTR